MNLQGRDLKLDLRGDDIASLHREIAILAITIPETERKESLFGRETQAIVRQFQTEHQIEPTGIVDAQTAKALSSAVDALTYNIKGKVVSRTRAGTSGLRIEIVDKNIGHDDQLGSTTTDDNGEFKVKFIITSLRKRGKQWPDLQVRVFSEQTFLATSRVYFNATNKTTINVLLTEQADGLLASEYETLSAAIATHFRGNLRDLEENNDRQDITYLANKTGWDARAVALSALADQFSARTAPAGNAATISPALFYALFRSGVPADEKALYQTDSKTVASIWKKALDQGIIPKGLENEITRALGQYQQLSVQHALDGPALLGLSPLKELLDLSLGEDSRQQQRFAALYSEHRDDPTMLWEAVRKEFGEAIEKRLKLDGQLSYLTLNNAQLIRKLHTAGGQNGLTNTVNLVTNGFHRADKWSELIGNDPIPPEFIGRDDADRRSRYAEVLAAQVRLSFPTAVVAEMVRSGETGLATTNLVNTIHAFLSEHQGNFEIGMQPIAQYVARNRITITPEVTREIARIQRVYQITPSDNAMNVLLKNGIDSAHAVVQYDQSEFIQAFQSQLGGETNARLTYLKSQQVHNTTLNLATTYLNASIAPIIGGNPNLPIIDPRPKGPTPDNADDIIAYPTLENLFGEMDFCACDHCRSILSPAAYLVDLLQFCDRKTPDSMNPQTVLFERRPDIQHLPLTCENTNTPLPYIDLVNETLEYYITNNLSLENYSGHSTDGTATPEELLASPMFVHEAAYTTLASASFPILLPFHQPLENLRRYFDKFESPLASVMEVLRKNDSLERANANEYGWRDILMEELRLSRSEYRLLTDRTVTLQSLYGFAPTTSDTNMLSELSHAKAYTRRLGISYQDIIEILGTHFINPNSTLIPKLERLGVPFSTLKALKDGVLTNEDFNSLLPPSIDPTKYGLSTTDIDANGRPNIAAWVKNEANFANIINLITLASPADEEDLCSFDNLEFRYANPDNSANQLRPFEYVRLIRFIRLWKKLGWGIEQTDKAITALYPLNHVPNDPSDVVNLERLDAGFLLLLPRLGILKRVMDRLKMKPKRDLLPLLACFAPIDRHGTASLYRQMFLSPSLLNQDPVFMEDGFGNVLTDNTATLTAHAEALRAACLLKDDEFSLIITALGFDMNTPLTLDTISAVFRRGWLARKLKFSVKEFLLLTRWSGIDPFAAPDPIDPPILRLLGLIEQLREASLKPTQALYLIWNQDISGKSAPDDTKLTEFARSLRSTLAMIEREFALTDDQDGSIARARMALVYSIDATDLFFGLLGNTFVTDGPYSHGQAALEQLIVDVSPGRILYDDFRKRLSYTGVLTPVTRDTLMAVSGVTAQFQAAIDNLYVENQKVIGPFFARYPELQLLYDAYVASNEPLEKKRSDLLEHFLPELKLRRKRQQAVQAIIASTKIDFAFADAILGNRAVLHAIGDSTHPALDDLTALEASGLSAQFFFADTASGNPNIVRDTEAALDYSPNGNHTLPGNGNSQANAISGIWNGFLEPTENGFYNFRIDADPGATVTLTLNGMPIMLAQNGNVWSNSTPIEFFAGILYAISLKVEKVKDRLHVYWETSGHGWEIIPGRVLYSAALINRLSQVYIRFLKATSLITALKLTAAEAVHFTSHVDYQIGGEGWLNHLPVKADPDNATATALLTILLALLDYARLKSVLTPDDERLLTILQDPAQVTQTTDSLLFTLTQWEPSSFNALLAHFGKSVADLAHLDVFSRMYDANSGLHKLGISASALIKATANEPNATIVRDLQAALRARYDESGWLSVLKPLNDDMRGLQRDALVAYILHQMRTNDVTKHIDTPDKLFEYFLMGRTDGTLHADLAHSACAFLDPIVIERLPNESRTKCGTFFNQRETMGMDEALPSVGGQQKGVPLAGKLDRARASRRPITILQGGDERIAARGYHRGQSCHDAAQLSC